MTRDKAQGIDAELIDDLNRFADLAERLVAPLHGLGRREAVRAAVLTHQHADMIRDAGEVARYQAREMVRGLKVPTAAGETATGANIDDR